MVDMRFVKTLVLCIQYDKLDGLGLRSVGFLSRLTLSKLTHL